jgi:D-threo-aldose 1-dehydrogenase
MIRAVDVGMNQPPLPECFVKRADLDCVLMAGRYSLLDTAAASSLLPCCQRHGVAVLAAGAFKSGILADPRHGATYDYGPATADPLDRAQRIRVVCARYGVPIGTAAIRFVLQHPAVTAVVVGTRHAAEVIEDVSYLTAAVPADLFSELAAERLIPEAADPS